MIWNVPTRGCGLLDLRGVGFGGGTYCLPAASNR